VVGGHTKAQLLASHSQGLLVALLASAGSDWALDGSACRGGLVSKGHPIAATGAAQLIELVTQLRNEAGARQVPGARLAVAENGGGFYDGEEAVAAVTVLEKI
jgi:acetyl-CoA acetyltransferase